MVGLLALPDLGWATFGALPRSHADNVLHINGQAAARTAGYCLAAVSDVRKLDLNVGDLVEIDGRRYEVVPGRQGGITFEPAITPMAELDKELGTRSASAEDFERLTAADSSDGEG